MFFTVRWPDGSAQQCYSPSLVMHEHLVVGAQYPVSEFVTRSTAALQIASERVREKFGFACTSAAAQIEDIAAASRNMPEGSVEVLTMTGADLLPKKTDRT
jgi:uncharacterized repeat protein (TIGR04042 family)